MHTHTQTTQTGTPCKTTLPQTDVVKLSATSYTVIATAAAEAFTLSKLKLTKSLSL